MIVWYSMEFCGGFAPGHRGPKSLSAMVLQRLATRFVRWRRAGVWDRLLEAVSQAYDGDIVMIDSTCGRVHQHGATGKKGMPTMVAWDVPVADVNGR